MMKLSTMRAVVATLNPAGQSPLAEQILQGWDHTAGSAQYLRASANFLFSFQHAGQRAVLRFNHACERTPAFIQAELDYVRALAAAGQPVAQPIRSLVGHDLESIETELGCFHAVVFAWLAGEQPEFSDLTPAMFTAWGRALGELHAVAQGYHGVGRPTWQDQIAAIDAQLPATESAARRALAEVVAELRTLPISPEKFGLIHFDFELDNLVWTDARIGLLDFDDCAWYPFAADIAFALRDLFGDSPAGVDLADARLRAFVAGYRQAKSLSEEELGRLPLFLRLHNLQTFVKLLRTVEASEQPEDPAWLRTLRAKLIHKIASYRASFVTAAQAVPSATSGK